ncbi:MAG: di-trans,poly-cis-decaprenylcistransferase [Rikenellaceae bacterium]|nr:di-trans,poly-cis-decaprenylcistransferase [Rikenellaceae bacterium]
MNNEAGNTTAQGNPLKHVAIIMDGNGRWARARGEARLYGHMQGVESVRRAIRGAMAHRVEYLTLYAFSTENWRRPQTEIDGLMELLADSTVREVPELKAQGVRLQFIGDLSALSATVRESIAAAERETRENNRLTLIIALNYSSRWEITCMTRELARKAVHGTISPDEITAGTVENHLVTAPYPDPDLLIRTSGEYRLSNFLLWQAAYSEFYFTEVLWPDFDEAEFDRAVAAYRLRDRRFGGVKNLYREKAGECPPE